MGVRTRSVGGALALGLLLALSLPGTATLAATPPSDPSELTALGSVLLFTADDGVNGEELWRSDGTSGGTRIVRSIAAGGNSAGPQDLTVVGTRAYFTAIGGGHPRSLWRTDGTKAGTVFVKENPGDGYFSDLVALGSRLLFIADTASTGTEFWVSDGTSAGTHIVKDIGPGPDAAVQPGTEQVVGSRLLFLAWGGSGYQVWKSDGTKSGTVKVKDLPVAVQGTQPWASAGGKYFFITEGPVGVFDLWVSDGSSAGTKKVVGLGDYSIQLVGAGGVVWFTGNAPNTGHELWTSDGTPGGTGIVKNIYAGSAGSYPYQITARGSSVFFSALETNGSQDDVELWKSNGTEAGTVRVKDIRPGFGAMSNPQHITNAGGTIYFGADDGTHGEEPWLSDGTEAGTVRLGDINPDGGSSTPAQFTKAGTVVYFTADDGSHGTELWRRTSGGVAMVKDIAQ